jgi:hypothetical protein
VTHYDVLGVSPSASAAEVRRAYVALARQHHPDRPGGDAATMRAVNEAWTVLGDPTSRARYDRSVGGAPTPRPPAAARVRTDDEELLADLADDTPLGNRIVLPRWLSLVPVAVFGASVATFAAGVMFSSAAALAAGLALFALSCALFLAAPFVALLSSRRANR